jgi:hypothetical protein
MKASFSVQARGANTTVFAALFAERNLLLGCGDAMALTLGGQRALLVREASSGTGPVHYTATFPSPASAASATITLERPAPAASAPRSLVFLPGPFALRDVASPVRVSAAEDVRFRLDPPMKVDVPETTAESVQLRVELAGPCLEPASFVWSRSGVFFPPLVKADGAVSIVNMRQFLKRKGSEAACDVALRVTELTRGVLDAAFLGPLAPSEPAVGSRHEEASFRLEW